MAVKEENGRNICKYKERKHDFSVNLNPLGMPMQVRRAIAENTECYESYPDSKCGELASAIAECHHVSPEHIACGNGVEDIIYRIVCSLAPEKALVVAPAFSEYEEALETFGCGVEYFYLTDENDFLPERGIDAAVYAGNYDSVFICNPGNPTGIPVNRGRMMDIIYACHKTDAVLVIDERFMDFLVEAEMYSMMGEISALPGVVILKSFDELFAMAGVQLGYCVCGDVRTAEKVRGCLTRWPVSSVASKAGVAALSVRGYADRTKAAVALEREKLKRTLISMGFKLYDSRANYVFFRSGTDIEFFLRRNGIVIKNCGECKGIVQSEIDGRYYYRLAVRTPAENRYLTEVLSKIMT